jgi:hypothetical protein
MLKEFVFKLVEEIDEAKDATWAEVEKNPNLERKYYLDGKLEGYLVVLNLIGKLLG